MIDWAQNQFITTVRTQGINQVFGTTVGVPVNQAIGLGKGLYDLDSHTLGTVVKGMNGDSAALQSVDQQIWNDTANIALPSFLSNIIPNSEKFYDQLQQWGTTLTNDVNQIGDKISGSVNNLTYYFSAGTNSGLQPGSPEAQAAQAGNLGTLQNIASTLDGGAYQPQGASQANGSSPIPTQAQNTSAATAAPAQGDPDEEDIDAPAAPLVSQVASPPPTSLVEYPAVDAISMKSTDPNSCIKTSNSLGVGSVSIDCNSSESLDANTQSAKEKPSTDEDDALMAAANRRMDNQEAGLSAAAAQSQNMANVAAMQELAASQAGGAGAAGKVGGACSNPNAGSGILRCQNIAAAGICDQARKLQACVSAAIPSCGGCASCVAQAQSLIASARATAASVCAN